MLILNNVNNNIINFYEDFIIINFVKTIIISKINIIKKKKIINKIRKKKIILKNYYFFSFFKKIKFGFYIEKSNKIFLPNNLIGIKINFFPKKIKLFEILFKILKYNNSLISTRKIYFKNKFLKKKIKVNKIYLGIIKNIVNYGIFIDIGKTDGLLHISDVPKNHKLFNKIFIKNIILVKIIKFDKKIKKISLSLKKIYKKKYKKNVSEIICCKILKKKNNLYYCIDKFYNKYLLNEHIEEFKKNDIVFCYLIKKSSKKSFLNRFYKINKYIKKFMILNIKYKSEDFSLCYYNFKYIINFYKNKINKVYNNNYYKYFIFNKIQNEQYKIIKIFNKIFIKFGNIILKTKNLIFFTIGKIYFLHNKIFIYIKNY